MTSDVRLKDKNVARRLGFKLCPWENNYLSLTICQVFIISAKRVEKIEEQTNSDIMGYKDRLILYFRNTFYPFENNFELT